MTRTLALLLFVSACTVVAGPASPSAPDDANQSVDTAAAAAIGGAIDGTVHAGHARYFAIALHAGDVLTVDVRAQVMESTAGNLEYDLALVDAGGTRVAASPLVPSNARASEWDPYAWTARADTDGTYYLRVHDDNVGVKTLRFHIALSLRAS